MARPWCLFWENALDRAAKWAVEYGASNFKKTLSEHEKARITENDLRPAVVGAIINLGQCLNFLDVFHMEKLRKSHIRSLVLLLEKHGPEEGEKNIKEMLNAEEWKHYFDCLAINELCMDNDEKSSTDTVRGCFPEGGRLFEGSYIRSKMHIQIAVRNTDCIIGYFRPKNLDEIFSRISVK